MATKTKKTNKAAAKKPNCIASEINEDGSISLPCSGKSLEQTLKSCGVDESKWLVDHYTIEENTRGYNFKVYLKKKEYLGQSLQELKKELSEYCTTKNTFTLKHKIKQSGLLLEFAPFDLHWGKLAWDKSIDYTLQTASKFDISKIVFPFGNDFFQIDNEQNTTTAGTRQDTDSRFKKILREGRKLIINTIDKLRTVAPVDVIIVSGNHGGLSEFMLGDLLEVKYENDKFVNVDNSPTSRKYYFW
jgi:hypothetical protein